MLSIVVLLLACSCIATPSSKELETSKIVSTPTKSLAPFNAATLIVPTTTQEEPTLTPTLTIVPTATIIPPPVINDKIQGYWASRPGNIISSLRNDAERMKDDGINTITFSPHLSHNQEGRVTEFPNAEADTKKAINLAHGAGFRVILEPSPMNPEVRPMVTNVELFQDDMREIVLKYAMIAEEYQVEFFSPIVEPAHHMGVEEADKWMQEILPEIREVYSGEVMWKKQDRHLTNFKQWDQDNILKVGFMLTGNGFEIGLKTTSDHKTSLRFQTNMILLEEYSGGEQKLRREMPIYLDKSSWHILQIKIKGEQIDVFLDDELVVEHVDESGPYGGYTIRSDGVRINQFEITDLAASPLLTEEFSSLNNWNAMSGWKVENGEMVGTDNVESWLVHDIDFSGYDYIAIDTFKLGAKQSIEEYIEYLDFVIRKTNQQAQADGVPHVIIGEFGGTTLAEIGWYDPDPMAKVAMTAEELAQVTRMVLELAEETTEGYIYNGWVIPGQGIKVIPEVEQVIKEWYTTR